MKTLNPFQKNRQDHIQAMLATTLIGYTNSKGEPASFDDVAWIYTYPEGLKVNLYFHDPSKSSGVRPSIRTVQEAWRLDDECRHLLMAFAISLISAKGDLEGKKSEN